jgi:hypothetical protein
MTISSSGGAEAIMVWVYGEWEWSTVLRYFMDAEIRLLG